LIIAGKPMEACEKYWRTIQLKIESDATQTKVLQKTHYIPDNETEFYFKAADVLALPYTHVFQSGVLFLAYSFGLPVVATDVGSVREDLIEGYTGFLCRACDSSDLAQTIERYFSSNLFRDLGERREVIRDYATHEHSWGAVSDITCRTYAELLGSAC
jgi:glycosyltransferase involved in cell wall biosynthesis